MVISEKIRDMHLVLKEKMFVSLDLLLQLHLFSQEKYEVSTHVQGQPNLLPTCVCHHKLEDMNDNDGLNMQLEKLMKEVLANFKNQKCLGVFIPIRTTWAYWVIISRDIISDQSNIYRSSFEKNELTRILFIHRKTAVLSKTMV